MIIMSQVKRYPAKKAFRLDCGHWVKPGEEFLVTKVFTCEPDAKQIPFSNRRKDESEEETDEPRHDEDRRRF